MIKRLFNPLLLLEKAKSIALFGPRGTGKSSLLKATLEKRPGVIRIDLLRGNAFQRYSATPSLFGDEVRRALVHGQGLTIVSVDEVQKVPALMDEVHALIEEHKGNVAFLLTGSSARKLKRGGANLLAGRALTRFLHPLSSLELDLDLDRALQYGTLPGIYLERDLETTTLESYVSAYLREEVLEEALVRRVDVFTRFLDLAGQLNGEPINFTKLARQCQVSTKTAQDYFSILCDTLLCRRVDGWAHSVKRQITQAPRFFFFDCGVLNALNGELRTALKPSSFRYGRLFETFVTQECVRYNDYQDLGLRFNYWRDKEGREVDLIVSRTTAKPLVGIEIKSGSAPTEDDLVGLAIFAEDYPKAQLWCFCTTPRSYQIGRILILPWQDGLRRLAEI